MTGTQSMRHSRRNGLDARLAIAARTLARASQDPSRCWCTGVVAAQTRREALASELNSRAERVLRNDIVTL